VSIGTRAPTTCCIEASDLAFKSAGVTKHDVDAYWLGTAQSGMAGITLSIPLKLNGKP
jgi:acetyl-CoA C-acetyltransferase